MKKKSKVLFWSMLLGMILLFAGCGGGGEEGEEELVLSSIAITTPATKLVYYEGDSSLDTSGLVVTEIYNNGIIEITGPVSELNITGFDTTTIGKKTLTITIGGKTATYEIEVKAKEIFESDCSERKFHKLNANACCKLE